MKKKATMELELATLQELTMKDQSKISSSLLNVDEGNCVFPRNEPPAHSFDNYFE